MADDGWIDDFILEVKKLAYDMPVPNPYTPMLLSHCLAAERRRREEVFEIEDARFRSLCDVLNELTDGQRPMVDRDRGPFPYHGPAT
ncbi:MAG: hypothetical protein ABW026_18935 [Microvirga sp.]